MIILPLIGNGSFHIVISPSPEVHMKYPCIAYFLRTKHTLISSIGKNLFSNINQLRVNAEKVNAALYRCDSDIRSSLLKFYDYENLNEEE